MVMLRRDDTLPRVFLLEAVVSGAETEAQRQWRMTVFSPYNWSRMTAEVMEMVAEMHQEEGCDHLHIAVQKQGTPGVIHGCWDLNADSPIFPLLSCVHALTTELRLTVLNCFSQPSEDQWDRMN